MTQRFGNGLALSTEEDAYAWDIVVDGTGDLNAVRGLSELEKDIAFRVGRALYNGMGFQPTAEYRKEVEVATRQAILEDPRIERIVRIEVETMNETVEVRVDCISSEDEHELVIEV